MKLENNETFKITYFAKKHGKHITRSGKWDDKCKVWTTTKGDSATTYFDVDAQNYRTAIGNTTIKMKG